ALSDAGIDNLFENSWGNPDKPATFKDGKWVDYHYISDIRGNGTLLAKPVACSDVINAFHTVDHDMTGVEMIHVQAEHQLLIWGHVPSELDEHQNLVDPEQNCPYGNYNIVSEQLQDIVFESPCAVP
ncbi:MAG: hypothetical protein AABX02_04650, partial [archaeon]